MNKFTSRSVGAIIISVSVLIARTELVFAADPTIFSILTPQTGKLPEVHQNDELRIRMVDGDGVLDPTKIKLLIERARLDVEPIIQDREVIFQLTRNEQTRPFWSRLVGPALDKRKTVSVGIEVNGKPLKYRLTPVGSDESPQQKIDLVPAEPAAFSVLTPEEGSLPDVALKGHLRSRVDGDTPIEVTKAQLRIDGDLLNVTPRLEGRELIFDLVRNDKNRDLWARLLGYPFSARSPVSVSVELGGKALKYVEVPKDDEAPEPKINIIPYNGYLMTAGIAGAAVVIVVSFLLAGWTTMMRDTLIPQIRRSDRPFSLGRFQMLVWFCLILSSFLLIAVVTFDINSITTESFVLLGISASTALGAVAIDRSKSNPDDPVQKARNNIESMGIKTCDQADVLFETFQKTPSQKASSIIPGAKTTKNNTDSTVEELWKDYSEQIAPFRSAGLLKDLVNDVNGPTIHRWQILIWTLVLGVIYVLKVDANLEAPAFGTNLLALMGITGGVYLGFKIPEKQS
jgi:hypothetical protein